MKSEFDVTARCEDLYLVRYKGIGILIEAVPEGGYVSRGVGLYESILAKTYGLEPLSGPLPADALTEINAVAYRAIQRAKALWPPGWPEHQWFWEALSSR